MAADPFLAQAVGIEDLAVVRNLTTAFEEESRNAAAYKAYAWKAEDDGYPGIASLFRAAARGDQIHASNHARVLRHLGGPVNIHIPEPRIESTFENLRSALVDQKFEVAYLYPTFLSSAVPLFDSTAIRSFHWALEADKSHVRLFSDLIRDGSVNGDSVWSHEHHNFFVCALCGYAARNPESENCPSCNYIWERFETIR